MNNKNGRTILLALVLSIYEWFVFLSFKGVFEFIFWHFLAQIVLLGYIYYSYRKKEDLLYPILVLIFTLSAGPFGLGAFLLVALMRPIFALFSSPDNVWFTGLFPEEVHPLFDQIILRIGAKWDDYEYLQEASSFHDLFAYGSLSDKQMVLDAIIKDFDPVYSPILKLGLKDQQNTVRIQSAAIITKIDTDFEAKLKQLTDNHHKYPEDSKVLLQLAKHAEAYASLGILEPNREKRISGLAVEYYQQYIAQNPDDQTIWMTIGKLLFHQENYSAFIIWYEESKRKFIFLPDIVQKWYLEALYRLQRLEDYTTAIHEFYL